MKTVLLEKWETWGQKVFVPVMLAIGAFLVYYPTLVYGFIFDDLPTIINYFHIKVFDPAGQFFSNSRWVSRLLNQFTFKYWQASPFAYRIVDVGMHIAVGLMIFFTMVTLLSGLRRNKFLQEKMLKPI